MTMNLLFLALGILLLFLGGESLIRGALAAYLVFGWWTERAGAALRRHADVAIGNILGSNIFNVLGILGVAALLQPLPVHERILGFDQWVMLGVTALLLVFLYTGKRLSRIEGALLLAG